MSKMKNELLLVEDEPMLLETLKEILEDLGLRVHCAINGSVALKILLENDKIGMVISDIQMHPVSGIELRYRAKELPQSHWPLHWLALTAHSSLDEQNIGMEGFDEIMFKPCSLKLLGLRATKILKQL